MKDAALVEVFTRARQEIASGNHRYICNAIICLRRVPHEDARKASLIVQKRLDGCNSLEAWMYKNHSNLLKNCPHPFDRYEKYRQARLDWLDSLIKEFSDGT